ncbi:hypothetical protein ACLVWU_13835 [Bdellovibrio sp. HCB290]|uniref:hypothetical protein n=1 Tax=Bdellovibrio sp. HCB290 TaxID=3394356 RepID=UPI0039B62E21
MKTLMIASLVLVAGTLINSQAQAAMKPQLQCEFTYYMPNSDDITLQIKGTSNNFIENNPVVKLYDDRNSDWGSVSLSDGGSQNPTLHIGILQWRQDIVIDHEQDISLRGAEGNMFGLKCHIYRIQDLKNGYNSLLSLPEPKPYSAINSSKSENHWFLGTTSFPYADVFEQTYEVREDGGFGVTEHDVVFNTNYATIVGYEVISNWHDGTNGKWSIDERTIGGTRAIIELRSKQFRGMNFTVKVYWVPNFNFAQDWRFNNPF